MLEYVQPTGCRTADCGCTDSLFALTNWQDIYFIDSNVVIIVVINFALNIAKRNIKTSLIDKNRIKSEL